MMTMKIFMIISTIWIDKFFFQMTAFVSLVQIGMQHLAKGKLQRMAATNILT